MVNRPPHYTREGAIECIDEMEMIYGIKEVMTFCKLNAYKYGFILRYGLDKEDITGYKYESWHLRYVGTELANILYNNGDWISMEDYFGITSKYDE